MSLCSPESGAETLVLRVRATGDSYHYEYRLNGHKEFQSLATSGADILISHQYTGAYLGLYTTANGKETSGYADVDRARYIPEYPTR